MAEPTPEDTRSSHVRTELARDMGLLHVTMIGVGAMIGAGIFILTGIAAGKAGPALILVFVFNGAVTMLTALSYAELGSCFPEAGGGYLWVKEALPQPNGFLSGWMSWFAHAVACSLYAVAFGSFATDLMVRAGVDLPHLMLPLAEIVGRRPHLFTAQLLAVTVTIIFAWINYRGAGETGRAETVVTVIKIVVIAIFIGFGIAAVFGDPDWTRHYTPFVPSENVDGTNGWIGILVAMGLTFVAFEGYEIIAQCGEEVIEPKRNIPRAIFISMAIAVGAYVLVAFVVLGAVDVPGETWRWLGTRTNPELAMVEAADEFIPYGGILFLLGGIFSTMSALNATIYSSSRVSFAMGRDHNLPSLFGKIHPQRRTPHYAVWISAVLIGGMAVMLPVEDIASATDVMFLFLFLLVNLSVINLRRHRPDLDRGFRVPWVPVIPILASILNLVLIATLFYEIPMGSWVSGGYIIIGIVIYLTYARRQEREMKAAVTAYQETAPVEQEGFRILVPIARPRSVDQLMGLAVHLARPHAGSITALNVVKVPSQLPVHEGRQYVEESKELLEHALEYGDGEPPVPVNALTKISHSISKTVLEVAEEERAELLLMGWFGPSRTKEHLFGSILDQIVDQSQTGVVLVRRPPEPDGAIGRILLPISDPVVAGFSFQVALDLQGWLEVPIEFFHLTPSDPDEARGDLMEVLEEEGILVDEEQVRLQVERGTDPQGAILAESRPDDLLIMGAPREGVMKRSLFGDIPAEVARAFKGPVLLTKPPTGRVKSWFQMVVGSRRVLID